ncbi:MAG: hypothetical protein ABIP27_11685 [Flavobacterium circumlabens]|uniref:hypothetical protein n=1 Tax=Flavobacterium circumlabens TaxID=2133765 RepID=UPI0010661783|nr:hypothetical protein [Flavobacterium circumlabens]
MKTAITILSMSFSILLLSCNTGTKKELTDAEHNLKKVNRDLQHAAKDSTNAAKEKTITEWKAFNEKSEKMVSVLNAELKQFQKKINTSDQKETIWLKKELIRNREKLKIMRSKLRDRNMEFENGLLKFDDSIASKNESFQREFNYDMDELSKAVKDLFINNVK